MIIYVLIAFFHWRPGRLTWPLGLSLPRFTLQRLKNSKSCSAFFPSINMAIYWIYWVWLKYTFLSSAPFQDLYTLYQPQSHQATATLQGWGQNPYQSCIRWRLPYKASFCGHAYTLQALQVPQKNAKKYWNHGIKHDKTPSFHWILGGSGGGKPTNMGMAWPHRVNPSETNKAPRCTKAMPKQSGKEMVLTLKGVEGSCECPLQPFLHYGGWHFWGVPFWVNV